MEEQTIELREYFQIFKRRMGIIVIISLISMLMGGLFTIFIQKPNYEVSSQLLVNLVEDHTELAPTSSSKMIIKDNQPYINDKLFNTYMAILNSPWILDKTASDLGLNISLKNMVKVTAENGSQVISITVDDKDPKRAVAIANDMAQSFIQKIKSDMKMENAHILTNAKIPEKGKGKNILLNIIISLMVSLMLSVGIVFLLEYLDNTLKSEKDIEVYLGLTVLGSIASLNTKMNKEKVVGKASVRMGGQHVED